jgi:putative ABC transport system permease protein
MLAYYAPKDLLIRVAAPPGRRARVGLADALLAPVRRIVREADPQQPISDVRTLDEIVADQTAPRAVQARVLGAFAAVALLLAALGIHGLLSFAVSQRAREIGVRRALGAPSGAILAMVLRGGALAAAGGVVPGLALAYGAGRALQGLLAGVDPGDGATFAAAAAVGLAMTISGSLLPALRALSVDPITVMRAE